MNEIEKVTERTAHLVAVLAGKATRMGEAAAYVSMAQTLADERPDDPALAENLQAWKDTEAVAMLAVEAATTDVADHFLQVFTALA